MGSDEKVEWCKKELNFDHVINYKKENFSEALSKIAPDGVDIYYDNVFFIFYRFFKLNDNAKKPKIYNN